MTLLTCILLITGDIYYNDTDKRGNVKKWSKANRFAAYGILAINVGWLLYSLSTQ